MLVIVIKSEYRILRMFLATNTPTRVRAKNVDLYGANI